jgi:hypothetical protein
MDEKFLKKISLNENNQADVVKSPSVVKTDDNFRLNKLRTSGTGLPKMRRFKLPKKQLFRIILAIGLVVLVFGLLGLNVYVKGKALMGDVEKLQSALASQDLKATRTQLTEVKKSLMKFDGAYKTIVWMKYIPFLGGYVKDGQHATRAAKEGVEVADLLIVTVEPYADLIGFNGGSTSGSGAETAEDRIDFIVKTLPGIVPQLDEISRRMILVRKDMDAINPNRYPERIRDMAVREKLKNAIKLIDDMTVLVTTGKPIIENLPYMLGMEEKRTYLVLFQNDKELRPTGGFLTAYSIMTVDKGKFEPVTSDDIYHLDAVYKPNIAAPAPIIKNIKGPYILSKNLRLRDMNWNPDFEESIKLFLEEADSAGLESVDGVIAVDTQLLVNLLEVTGPIGVSGFGNFSTEIEPKCNCPQVIYELESFADVEGPIVWDPNTGEIVYRPANSDNRKRIIGPLMNAVLANTFAQPKEKVPKLVDAGLSSLLEKHVLFYLYDEKVQDAVEGFNIAGKIKDYNGDYLYINDANLAGRKSNLYVTQDVNQEIEIAKDGTVVKTVTITYKNPQRHDGWLNSVLPNWVRVYVPKDSELMSFEGVTDKESPYEESGKTVYAGFFELRPQGVAKVTLKYRLPFKVKDEYKLLIQKQPGKDAPLYITNLGRNEMEDILISDKEFKFEI